MNLMIEHLVAPGIYMSRHGECLANVEKRIIGVKETPLTENGLKQAHDLGSRLSDESIDFIISSPLSRAYITASIIGAYSGVPVVALPQFRPQSFGILEGYTREEAQKEGLGQYLHKSDSDKYTHFVPDGETAKEAQDRIATAYQCLNSLIEQENWIVLMVLHNSVIRSIVGHTWNLPPHEWTSMTVPNCNVFGISEKNRSFIEVILRDKQPVSFSESRQARIKSSECLEWQKLIPFHIDGTIFQAKMTAVKEQLDKEQKGELPQSLGSLYNRLHRGAIADYLVKASLYEEIIIREFISWEII